MIIVCAAFVIQKAFRNYQRKKIMVQKVKTRHQAAVKIQAAWNGFWIRSRKKYTTNFVLELSLRFSYGEVIFLIAVRKSLVNCHFILKVRVTYF